MIIFFNKTNGQVFGVIDGRVHDQPEKEFIQPSNLTKKEVGKFIVPFKLVYKEVATPIKKWFLINKDTQEVEERIVGTKIEKVVDGLTPDVEFAQLILDFESKKEDIYKYRVKLDQQGHVIGFEKNV